MVPSVYQFGFVEVDGALQPTDVCAVRQNDVACRQRLLAGRLFEARNSSVMVTELLLYRLGLFDEQNLSAALGKKLRLEFRQQGRQSGFSVYLSHPDNSDVTHAETVALDKIRQQLPVNLDKFDLSAEDLTALHELLDAGAQESEPVTEEFTIVGIVRMMNNEEEQTWDPLARNADVILPTQTAADLYFHMPRMSSEGLARVIVVVDRDENIKPVVEQVRALGWGQLGAGICQSTATDVRAHLWRHDLRGRSRFTRRRVGNRQHDAHQRAGVPLVKLAL